MKTRALFIVFLTVCLFDQTALCQSYIDKTGELVSPRWYLSVGGYFPSITSSMRVDSERGLGTEINLEDDFKLDATVNVGRFTAMYNFKKKSQLVFTYTSFKRSNTFTLDRDFRFLDTVFYLNAKVDLRFDVFYYALTWRYSVFNKENWNAGFSLGARMAEFKPSISAGVNNRNYSRSTEVWAPAVVLGVHGSAYLTPSLMGRYSLEYFQLSLEGIDMKVLETNVSLTYFILKNIGVGGGYSTSAFKVLDIPLSRDFTGKIDFAFEGFTLFVAARF